MMRALDLFAGAGGAARGLQQAGFHVTGVDIRPQPRYAGDLLIRADALQPPVRLSDFDFIWASPPCQHASIGAKRWIAEGREYPALIGPTRDLLSACGVPYVIENVVGADLRPDLVLTGEMFGLKVIRRRHFELGGWWCMGTPRPFAGRVRDRGGFCTVAGHGGHGPHRLSAWCAAMDIDWMVREEITEAIPPAYSRFIGEAFLAQRRNAAA